MALKTLTNLCAQTLELNQLPQSVLEERVLELNVKQMINFVNSKGSIAVIQSEFTKQGFQLFLLYIIRQFENLDKNKMDKNEWNGMDKMELCTLLNDFQYANLTSRGFNKNLDVLGLGHFYQGDRLMSTNRCWSVCMKMRFHQDWTCTRIPIPKCRRLSLPQEHSMQITIDRNQRPYEESDNFDKKSMSRKDFFMLLLLGLFLSFRKKCWHESLAYAFHLLSNKNYYDNGEMQKNFLYIWGMLAVCLAEIGKSRHLIFSCLEKMNQFVVIKSDELDAALYTQKVYGALGQHHQEKEKMMWIIQQIPVVCEFHPVSAKYHIKCQIWKIVKLMARGLCDKKMQREIIEKCEEKIDCLRRAMHHLMTFPRLELYFKMSIEIYFRVLDVLEMACEEIYFPHQYNRGAMVMVKGKFSIYQTHHHLWFVLTLITRHTSLATYRTNMERVLKGKRIKSRLQVTNSGNKIMFMHATLLLCFKSNISWAKEILKDCIEKFYIEHDKKMAKMLLEGKYDENNATERRGGEEEPNSLCTVEWILSSDPSIGEWTRFGIESCKLHDEILSVNLPPPSVSIFTSPVSWRHSWKNSCCPLTR